MERDINNCTYLILLGDLQMVKDDLFKGAGVEVELKNDEDFLKIKETLTRIGVASHKNKTLYQSAHIFHKQGRYAIVHFKELFLFDGKESNITENDLQRRNTITKLLQTWGLLDIIDESVMDKEGFAPFHQIEILSYKDAQDWDLVAKYNIGKKG